VCLGGGGCPKKKFAKECLRKKINFVKRSQIYPNISKNRIQNIGYRFVVGFIIVEIRLIFVPLIIYLIMYIYFKLEKH
jgi:hypothetical protein